MVTVDFAGNSEIRKSTSGLCIFMNNGNLVIWSSKKNKIYNVLKSNAKAESRC